MLTNKVKFFSIAVGAMLSACSTLGSPSNVEMKGKASFDYVNNLKAGQTISAASLGLTNVDPKTEVVYLGDVGKGKKGGNVSVTLGFGDNTFGTKATANGTPPTLVSAVTHAKLYLTTSNTDPLLGTALKFTSSVLTYTGASKTYTFGNVPQGGPYFVAVELFDNVAAAPANNLIKPIAYGGTTGTLGITVSAGAVPSVTVDANNAVNHTNALTIAPALKDGVGATIDATVTPSAGAGTVGPITAS